MSSSNQLFNKSIENINIQRWIEGKSIFITGGTGFMGKVLVEKLLRSCNVDTIFLLCRSKRGKTAQARIDEMGNLALFDLLKKQKPKELKKLVAIEGDILKDKLGLKEESINLLRSKVSIIFNVAADVKLDAKLKETIENNTRGALRMLELAENLPKLEVTIKDKVELSSPQLNRQELREDSNKHAERVYDAKTNQDFFIPRIK